ncbi:MAG: preprotein translocase subunit YajC [Planctomycetes bacterium]|nr:preprotein translocase subunit YajC [Planctomycetota bacterium]
MIAIWNLLAQAAPASQPARPGGGSLLSSPLIGILLMVAVFYFIMMRGGRKDRRRHQEMLDSMQRNDRVQTIGGVIGTVVEVRENEVVLKVDETSNTKMRFSRGAIKEVIRDSSPE